MKYFLPIAVFIFGICIAATKAFSEDDNKDEIKKKERPDHIHTLLYQKNENDTIDINACDVSLIDTFRINSESTINNFFFFTYSNIKTDKK